MQTQPAATRRTHAKGDPNSFDSPTNPSATNPGNAPAIADNNARAIVWLRPRVFASAGLGSGMSLHPFRSGDLTRQVYQQQVTLRRSHDEGKRPSWLSNRWIVGARLPGSPAESAGVSRFAYWGGASGRREFFL